MPSGPTRTTLEGFGKKFAGARMRDCVAFERMPHDQRGAPGRLLHGVAAHCWLHHSEEAQEGRGPLGDNRPNSPRKRG